MSEGEERESLSREIDPAIWAIAPRLHQEEGPTDVTASPAFQCLDDLFSQGKLAGERVAKLKAKYTSLHECLKSTREQESSLLHKAKDMHQEVQRQRSELEKGDSFPDGDNTDVNKLRQELLKHHNELAQADERQYLLEFKLEGLREEKVMLEREYSRMPKPGEMEKQSKELQKSIEELKVEIAQRTIDTKNLKEEVENREKQVNALHKEVEGDLEEQQKLKDQLVQVHSQPAHISKQTDLLSRQLREVEEKRTVVDGNVDEIAKELQRLEGKKFYLEEDKTDLSGALDRQRHIFESKEREVDMLAKEFELAKERQAEFMGDRGTLDLNLKHAATEKKSNHDIHARKIREKERDLKNALTAHERACVEQMIHEEERLLVEQSELRVDVIDLTRLAQIKADEREQKARDYMRAELRYQRALEDLKTKNLSIQDSAKKFAEMQHRLADFAKLYDVIKNERNKCVNLIQTSTQNALTAHERACVEQMIHEEERLLVEQSELRVDVIDLTRLAQIKADEREQKARDYMRAELRYQRALEDLKTKNLSIQDSAKKFAEMQHRLADFAKLYDVIKNERNKCVNLIQTSTQKAAEMREKTKILQNEIEILRSKVNAKDRRLDIAKLNDLINKAEENMVQLRKRYESSVQERNDMGIHLIETNEEVCVFYEKLNIQGNSLVNELKRSIAVAQKNMPNKRALDNELVTLQIQLVACRERLAKLEKQLEDPSDESRIRLLGGQDPEPEVLAKKIEELELRLAEKEEKLLEKDLIFEEVTRLADRTKKKSESGKEDTLELAKKVNEYQAKIKDTTRKMMALVSELSMNQAAAMKLQQEVKSKEQELEQSYVRMEKGEAPNEEAEREWLRMIRDEARREKELTERKQREEEEEHYRLPGDVHTTAEPRPNAYIPDDDTELPIPRPYGSMAPFKPTEPGSTMRHIRKPVIKPIEI
ncbi:PREDICTED: coiled-coil domain-containing protein 146-like [Acropora digitifera]|uniref:coiled-coil domain-containing protein 146-like n=1 Tax=Acropora digitifera TaxID=70779 RepID=UPI00077A42AF|nr:PREDICTED: coiled-coil domain-containing protein 146-like [Acropora digitifera]